MGKPETIKQEVKMSGKSGKEVAKKEEGGVPAELRELYGEGAKENLANIEDAYYRISISLKSKFFVEGEKIGENGETFQAVILRDIPVNAYYKTPFDPDNPSLPDCWSLGGFKPDKGVDEPVHHSCGTCPMNKYNTAVGKDGSQGKGKACANNRRLVLHAPGMDMPALISLPPTSRKNLDQYLKRLASHGIPLYAVVTEFSFDDSVDYPKVILKQIEFLPKDEFLKVKSLRESPEIEKVAMAYATHEEGADQPQGDENF